MLVKIPVAVSASAGAKTHALGPSSIQDHVQSGTKLGAFEYTVEQWAEIARSFQHFDISQEMIEKAHSQLQKSARSYLLEIVNKPKRKQARNWRLKHWIRTGKLADALISEMTWLSRNEQHPPDPSGRDRQWYSKELEVLLAISVMAQKHAVGIREGINDGYPESTAKGLYHSRVLDVWTELGGKLRFSRHPSTGHIKGPLVRYFLAVTQPLHGGSPESLPDIIERHVARKKALDEWRRRMAIANGLP